MQEAQLSNVKPDGNYPELVSHLQYSQFLECCGLVFFFFFKVLVITVVWHLKTCLLFNWLLKSCTVSCVLERQWNPPRDSAVAQAYRRDLTCFSSVWSINGPVHNRRLYDLFPHSDNLYDFPINAIVAIYHIPLVLELFFTCMQSYNLEYKPEALISFPPSDRRHCSRSKSEDVEQFYFHFVVF